MPGLLASTTALGRMEENRHFASDVIAGAVPYAGLMLLFTSALILWPDIATWLPQAVGR